MLVRYVHVQAIINSYLAVESLQYPDVSTLPYVAVWPDYGTLPSDPLPLKFMIVVLYVCLTTAKNFMHAWDHWHYVDFAYCPLNWPNATMPRADNLLDILPLLQTSIQNYTTPDDGITPSADILNGEWTKNFAIRFMTHLIGDLHQ